MHSMEEIAAFIKAESILLDEDIHILSKLEQEDEQAKAAFGLVVQSSFHGRTLTRDEKIEIETQLKEVLKTADLVALTILPGGTVVLILSSFLKLNPYILPSVFLSKP